MCHRFPLAPFVEFAASYYYCCYSEQIVYFRKLKVHRIYMRIKQKII